MTILITAATGTVGRSLVAELLAAGAPVRALVRDPERAAQHLPAGAELAPGDFDRPRSVRAALAGVDQVFLAAPNHPSQVRWETSVVEAAERAGVRRLVKLSAHGARLGSDVAFWDAHARIEQHLARSGLAWVSLRPATYATTLLAWLEPILAGVLAAPAAGARVGFVDPADVAAVASRLLQRRRWDTRSYTLTGPEPIDFDRVAAVFAGLLGRPVAFAPVPDDVARHALLAAGAPPWFAQNVIRVFGALRSGLAELATPAVQDLTGAAPRSLSEALRGPLAALGAGAAGDPKVSEPAGK